MNIPDFANLKINDYIVCVYNSGCLSELTIDKKYIVIDIVLTLDLIHIKNDLNFITSYAFERFITLDESRTKKLKQLLK